MNAKHPEKIKFGPALQLAMRVPPMEMLAYIQTLMSLPKAELKPEAAMAIAEEQWGAQQDMAQAAMLRWGALSLAFHDKRLETWTVKQGDDRLQVAAALVAAAGIAPLEVQGESAAFDIPRLLDTTLELAPVAGNA